MELGKIEGIKVALGIIAGDIIIVLTALLGGRWLFTQPAFLFWFSILGSLLLLSIGLKYILLPGSDADTSKKSFKLIKNPFLNGFLINFVNPFVFAVWIGFIAYNESIYTSYQTKISLSATLLTIFSTDLLKALFANKIQSFIRPKYLPIIHKVVGFIMILFATRLVLYTFKIDVFSGFY